MPSKEETHWVKWIILHINRWFQHRRFPQNVWIFHPKETSIFLSLRSKTRFCVTRLRSPGWRLHSPSSHINRNARVRDIAAGKHPACVFTTATSVHDAAQTWSALQAGIWCVKTFILFHPRAPSPTCGALSSSISEPATVFPYYGCSPHGGAKWEAATLTCSLIMSARRVITGQNSAMKAPLK